MRRLLLLSSLTLTFAGLLALSRAAQGWHFVVSGAPGDLLYVAAFDGFLDEWEQAEGRNAAEVIDGLGVMQIRVGEANNMVWAPAALRFADFDLTVQATAVDGPEDDDNGFGVIFRLSDDRRSFYTFMVSSDGYYSVERRVDGQARYLSNWVDSPVVNQGLNAVNTLRVVARGDTFTFYINGRQVQLCVPDNPAGESTYRLGTCIGGQMRDTLTDTALTSGRVGVVALTQRDKPGVVVNFDHVVIYQPHDE